MNVLMSDITSVVNRHVCNAIMKFNTSRVQEDISKCKDKIQQLENDLWCLTKDKTASRTRIQETTYRINVSLVEQELTSYREKLQTMQTELEVLNKTAQDTSSNVNIETNNIILSIDEVSQPLTCTDNISTIQMFWGKMPLYTRLHADKNIHSVFR